MEHCEHWVTGSIYIGGAGVALGYYGDAIRTAAQFVTHPLTKERLFRTGDLGRLRPDGNIEILGREDSQVKVNGFRVELGEIEHVLSEHSGVDEAYVCVSSKGKLVAFLKGDCSQDAILNVARKRLPAPLVPSSFHFIHVVPLNRNGKVDRKRLIKSLDIVTTKSSETKRRASLNKIETQVASLWASVLNLHDTSSLHPSSNFFQCGGDSLRALQMIYAARKQFRMNISVKDIFAYPTIELMARRVKTVIPRSTGGDRSVASTTLTKTDDRHLFTVKSSSGPETSCFPLCGITKAYWIGLLSDSCNPHIYFEWTWKEPCDVKRLERAVNTFVAYVVIVSPSIHSLFSKTYINTGTHRRGVLS